MPTTSSLGCVWRILHIPPLPIAFVTTIVARSTSICPVTNLNNPVGVLPLSSLILRATGDEPLNITTSSPGFIFLKIEDYPYLWNLTIIALSEVLVIRHLALKLPIVEWVFVLIGFSHKDCWYPRGSNILKGSLASVCENTSALPIFFLAKYLPDACRLHDENEIAKIMARVAVTRLLIMFWCFG